MTVTVYMMSHHHFLTPENEVLWLLELTAIETCNIIGILLHLAHPVSMACDNQPKAIVES
jgi:hypothetical protein